MSDRQFVGLMLMLFAHVIALAGIGAGLVAISRRLGRNHDDRMDHLTTGAWRRQKKAGER